MQGPEVCSLSNHACKQKRKGHSELSTIVFSVSSFHLNLCSHYWLWTSLCLLGTVFSPWLLTHSSPGFLSTSLPFWSGEASYPKILKVHPQLSYIGHYSLSSWTSCPLLSWIVTSCQCPLKCHIQSRPLPWGLGPHCPHECIKDSESMLHEWIVSSHKPLWLSPCFLS